MYMEDVDLGDRLQKAGWLNVYVPSAEVLHDKGHSTGRDPGANLAAHHRSTYTIPCRPAFRLVAGPAAVGDASRAWRCARGWWCADERRRSGEKGGTASEWTRPDVDAVVLVGGKGTRLRPLTLSAPKPMLPTAGLPFLTHLLSRIAAAGIEHVMLGTSYQGRRCSRPSSVTAPSSGCRSNTSSRSDPLGTGGGIANVASKLRHDTVLVFNGDVLSGADLGALLEHHHEPPGRCHPAPGAGGRPPRVRLRADRRRRSGDGLPGEDAGSADRSDQRRLLRLHAGRSSTASRAAGRSRSSAKCSRRCCPTGVQGLRLRRRDVLARYGHAGGFRARFGRSGPRHRARRRRCAVIAASSWCTTALRCRRERC